MLLEQSDVEGDEPEGEKPEDREALIGEMLNIFTENILENGENIRQVIRDTIALASISFANKVMSPGGLSFTSWVSDSAVTNSVKRLASIIVKIGFDDLGNPSLGGQVKRALVRAFFHMFMGAFRTVPSESLGDAMYLGMGADKKTSYVVFSQLIFTSNDTKILTGDALNNADMTDVEDVLEQLADVVTSHAPSSPESLIDLNISLDPDNPVSRDKIINAATIVIINRIISWWGLGTIDTDIKKSLNKSALVELSGWTSRHNDEYTNTTPASSISSLFGWYQPKLRL